MNKHKWIWAGVLVLGCLAFQGCASSQLLKAAADGDLNRARTALKWGANVNAQKYSNTPLIQAARRGHDDMAQLLLDNGADVNARIYGKTALEHAVENWRSNMVKLLLREGADANAKERYGGTPLQTAAARGYTAAVELMLDSGADPNIRRDSGETPLHFAAKGGHTDVVMLLLDSGADVNAKSNNGETAIICAAEQGYWSLVKFLARNGGDADAKTKDGASALTIAFSAGADWGRKDTNWNAVGLLAECGAKGAADLLALDELATSKGLYWPQHRAELQTELPAPKKGEEIVTLLWPPISGECKGDFTVRIKNPNDFAVLAALRSYCARNMLVLPESTNSVRVSQGSSFEVYFVYSDNLDALYQGDDIKTGVKYSLYGIREGIEIKIVKVVGGNYSIRRID